MLTRPEFASVDLSRLVYLATAGAGASAKLRELYRQRFGREMLDGYGLTEGLASSPAASPKTNAGKRHRPPPAHLDVRILDDQGEELPPARPEKSASVPRSKGIYSSLHADAGLLAPAGGDPRRASRWMAAYRDLGYRDEAGMFVINARSSDMILRGGANIYPREIEQILQQDPRVREAIAFGMPDERLGQIVAAAVEMDEGTDTDRLKADLAARAQAKLARYKRPSCGS